MYWSHEHSVTAVEASKVCSTNTLEIGSDCEVVITDKKYEGKISAKGKYIKKLLPYIYCVHFLIIHLGTKAEMEKLEDQFVAGSWAPPFMTPPKKKRKVKQRQQQPKEKTQKENKPKKTKEKSKQTYCNSNNNDKLLCFLDKILMVTNPPVFTPIVSSPHQFITPLSNHDITQPSIHPFSSGTLTTSTISHPIMKTV